MPRSATAKFLRVQRDGPSPTGVWNAARSLYDKLGT
jgi:hypothetical protein